MLDKLFKFPAVMIDSMQEENKRRESEGRGMEGDDELEIIIGETELPYFAFRGISDRWIPTTESYNKALNDKFEACLVYFEGFGEYIVPWNKEKFKKEWKAFSDSKPQEHIIKLSSQDIKDMLTKADIQLDEDES